MAITTGQLAVKVGSTVLGYASEASLSVSNDTIDTTSKMDGNWQTQFPGKKSWQITSSGLYTEQAYALLTAWKARQAVSVAFGEITVTPASGDTPASASVASGHSGSALITSLEITSDAGEIAKFSITLSGDGALI